MLSALLLVHDPILHPIAARPGDVLAWYAATDIAVLRCQRGAWSVVRRLGHDNAGALAGLLALDVIVPFSDEDARLVSQWLVPPASATSREAS